MVSKSWQNTALVSMAIAMNRLTFLSHLTCLPWFRMNDFTCWKWSVCVHSSRHSAWTDDMFHSTACSVASFGTFVSWTLPYTAYRCTGFFFNNSQTLVCRSNEWMKKCKSVNLYFFLYVYVAQISQYVFSFIPNQWNSEVGSPMLFTIPYQFFLPLII